MRNKYFQLILIDKEILLKKFKQTNIKISQILQKRFINVSPIKKTNHFQAKNSTSNFNQNSNQEMKNSQYNSMKNSGRNIMMNMMMKGSRKLPIYPLQSEISRPLEIDLCFKQSEQIIAGSQLTASLPKKDNNELSPSSQSSSNNLEIVQQDEINHKADFDRVVQKLKKAFSILKILKILYKLQFRFWICKYKGRKENINIRNRVKIFSIYQAIGTRSFWMSIFGEKKTSGDLYAMKIIVWAQKQLETKLDTLKAERNSLEILSGEFVVKAYFSFSHEQYLCFVQEYIIGGDFSHILKMYTALDEEYVRHQIAEIVLALEYLRSKKNCTQRFKT
ncbi:unnamed protein product [Paramecium primaurelia]|uniref:non-specific serine/threonine protein kinase n=1 Tax=Paramecium primaurelia TaxID=5886 RepID=A0A8S1JV91_PARPR|nr:unnamed protein product [Paramecium primaurelia]